MRGLIGAVLAAGLASACAPIAELPSAPVPYGDAITVAGAPVPMDPTDPANVRLGNFRYAGGLLLTSDQTSRLHGLSDLKVWPDGRLLAQGDQADVFEGRIVLDAQGRLAGVTNGRISALKDADGAQLYPKGQIEFDTEGVAEFANGDRLVAFEQHDRILLYPRGGGLPRPAPMPNIAFLSNLGMEALSQDPAKGADAYRVGVEVSGELFDCKLSTACAPAGRVSLQKGDGLTALAPLSGGRWAYLIRSFTALAGSVGTLRIVGADGAILDEMTLKRPLTVDNMEGLGVVERPGAPVRFYIVSDDNFGLYDGKPTDQRTYLLAFDWAAQGR